MLSYTATIGRNFSPTHPLPGLQGKPMTLSAWERFIEDVEADMRTAIQPNNSAPVAVEIHRGKGEWNGVTEESAKITVLADKPVSPVGMTVLRGLLSSLSYEYGQDAIAFTVGTSELIGNSPEDNGDDMDDCPVCERVTRYDGEECTECGRLWGIDYSRADIEERQSKGNAR